MLRELAEYRKKILIGAILGILIAAGIAVSATWSASSDASIASSSGIEFRSGQSINPVDCGINGSTTVPVGTTSLNLTYSQIRPLGNFSFWNPAVYCAGFRRRICG